MGASSDDDDIFFQQEDKIHDGQMTPNEIKKTMLKKNKTVVESQESK